MNFNEQCQKKTEQIEKMLREVMPKEGVCENSC